ncbi:hypothetical protein BZA77DRAFT_286322 [Pyronema omphalodes]|nr:hypothetical protein BZA77DRAFT_286322 [Pyronema omphalodes]
MSISHRISIRWLPTPASEPHSVLVLTSPERRYVDLRLTLSPSGNTESLYWGFAGQSFYPTPNSGRWEHFIDSRSDEPGCDEGSLEVLKNGDVLEKGRMVDFEEPEKGVREYEEVWRDEVLDKDKRVAIVLDTQDGRMVRVGGWVQAVLKSREGFAAGRWKEGEKIWAVGKELILEEIWENEKELVLGEEIEREGVVWKVVERAVW